MASLVSPAVRAGLALLIGGAAAGSGEHPAQPRRATDGRLKLTRSPGVGWRDQLAPVLQCTANPVGISPTIQHTMNDGFTPDDAIVNGVGKPPREKSIIAELKPMDPGVEHQRIDLREQAVEELPADALLLTVIELSPRSQILQCRAKDSNLHSQRFRSSFFASSQSSTSIFPAARSASVCCSCRFVPRRARKGILIAGKISPQGLDDLELLVRRKGA